jgi:hypothetical protein
MAVPERDKRTIMVKIWVDGTDVRFEQVSFVQEMLNTDQVFSGELKNDQAIALGNRNKRRDHESLNAGDRVQADDYKGDLEYPHPGIHLSRLRGDEVMWYSEQRIKFTVDINRDPELVLLDAPVPGTGGPAIKVHKAVGIDIENPFDKDFPLTSWCGEPVFSGAIRTDENDPEYSQVLRQRYYKYTVTVDGIKKPLDPHIEGHYDN